jgi:predicted DNA-binding protein (MmcQ/YjbR family)
MKKSAFTSLVSTLRKQALSYPETTEDFPWGESAFKVRGKVFCFLWENKADRLSFTVKLPASHLLAKERPNVSATGYGLGKSGWITLTILPSDKPDKSLLSDWIFESFCAVAPKKLVQTLS